jgi:hypothetical protein
VKFGPKKQHIAKESHALCHKQNKTRGVSHCGLAIYILKVSKGKRRIMEIQIFHHAKI